MPSLAFLNGLFLQPHEASIAALDSGLQHGVGLFETMLGGIGPDGEPRVVRLGDHLDRLATSARELRLSDSIRTQALGDAVLETLRRSELPRARIRLTITGGGVSLLPSSANANEPHAPPRIDPTILIVAQPATVYPDEMFARGVRVAIADARVNPLMPDEGHKTLNYWWRLRELQQASAKGAAEALVFQVTNHLAGGCVSNAFVVTKRDGQPVLLTPKARGDAPPAPSGSPTAPAAPANGAVLPSPVLPGITRAAILDAAAESAIPVERRMITIDEVLGADELFLTNSSWGVLPIVAVEREAIADAHPGPVTQQLRSVWAAAVERELAGG